MQILLHKTSWLKITRLIRLPAWLSDLHSAALSILQAQSSWDIQHSCISCAKSGMTFSTEKPWRTFEIGGTRTLIDVGAGISYGLLFAGIVNLARIQSDAWSLGLFFVFLIPVRLGEWYWLLRIAFRQKVRGAPRIPWSLGWGTSVSFALDAIGVAAAFVMPGGMWVC